MDKKHKCIFIKTPQGEMNFNTFCDIEYKRLLRLMSMIENEFNTELSNHYEIRNEILDTSNFIKRLPTMVSEVMIDDKK